MNSTQWGRDKMVKGYFGKTKGKGTRKSPLKVLREVVENTELIESGRGRPKTMDRPFPSDTRDYRKVNKKPKNKYYLSKWVTAREVAEIKGMGKSWAMILINRGHFGKTTGKGVRHNPLKVLREVVENTEMIGREDYGKVKSSSSDRPKQETFKPKVIMRTSIGSTNPLNGGVQHTNNYTEPFKQILGEVDVVLLNEPEEIFPAFENAYNRDGSSLIIEWGDYYNDK